MSRQGVAQRLPRLLSLVPYLRAHPGVPVAEAAADFGVDEKQLRRDLELLWMCGLPGYGPGDLVDLAFAGDTVDVVFDAGLTRPLRLTTTEATALLVALRMLHQSPGVVDSDAVARAIGKIEAAVGEAAGPGGLVTVESGIGERGTTAVVRRALDRGRALRIVYFTASRDAVSRRDVDPMRLVVTEGRGYLEAWCRRAEGVRMFRLDRVEQAEELDEPARAHPEAEPTDVSHGLFGRRAGQRRAVLELAPPAHWVAEYYPVDEVRTYPVDDVQTYPVDEMRTHPADDVRTADGGALEDGPVEDATVEGGTVDGGAPAGGDPAGGAVEGEPPPGAAQRPPAPHQPARHRQPGALGRPGALGQPGALGRPGVDDPEPGPDGRLRVLLRFADPDWLVRLVLGLGGAARIVEPAELADVVRERAREALSRVDGP